MVGWGLVRPRCLLSIVCASLDQWPEAYAHRELAYHQAGDDPGLWEQEALAMTDARLAALEGHWVKAQSAFERATMIRNCMGVVDGQSAMARNDKAIEKRNP